MKSVSELPVTARPGSILLNFSCFFFPSVFSLSDTGMLGRISYVRLRFCKKRGSQALEESANLFLFEIVSHSQLHRHKHRRNLERKYVNI